MKKQGSIPAFHDAHRFTAWNLSKISRSPLDWKPEGKPSVSRYGAVWQL